MRKTADVIIIGSGVIGNAAAYYLSKKGVSVIVLEKNETVGDGGSSRNGGGVRQSGRDRRELPLAIYAIQQMWPRLSDELGVDVEYYRQGNLRLGKTDEHLSTLNRLTNTARSCGLDVRMVSGKEAKEICPFLSDEVIGASWCPTDGHANPLTTTLAFYKKSHECGAEYITGESVYEIQKIRGRARRVVTRNGAYEAGQIIVAAGYDSRDILASVGIDVPMTRVLLEALVTEAQPPMFYQMLGTATADFYGHQTKHGSFVFGGSPGLENTFKDNGTPTSASMTAPYICRAIQRYFPMLADVKIVRTWAGWMDDCADGIPVISKIDEVPGLTVACGFTGHGFGISPVVGKLLSELATDEKPTVDLGEFRYDRFKAKL
jgi:Glycine/D-amino acid oxidases (deaminating)